MQSESESLVICRLFATRAALKAPSPPSPPLEISPGQRAYLLASCQTSAEATTVHSTVHAVVDLCQVGFPKWFVVNRLLIKSPKHLVFVDKH